MHFGTRFSANKDHRFESLSARQPTVWTPRLYLKECEWVRSKVVSIETNQICLTIFSLAVDKRTKNNLYVHWVSVFIIYSSIETFALTELTFGFDRMNSRSKQPSIELTWYLSETASDFSKHTTSTNKTERFRVWLLLRWSRIKTRD